MTPERRLWRGRSDDGAVMVEAAIIAPVFLVLMIMVFEGASLMRDYITLNNATVAAARTAAIEGNDNLADYVILQNFEKESLAIPQGEIQRIVVFKAPNGTSGPLCTTGGSVSGTCNVYTVSDLQLIPAANPLTYFGNCPTTVRDCYWNPTTRKIALTDPPDFLGIYVLVRHPYVTKLFGSYIDLDATVVTRLEPQKVTP